MHADGELLEWRFLLHRTVSAIERSQIRRRVDWSSLFQVICCSTVPVPRGKTGAGFRISIGPWQSSGHDDGRSSGEKSISQERISPYLWA